MVSHPSSFNLVSTMQYYRLAARVWVVGAQSGAASGVCFSPLPLALYSAISLSRSLNIMTRRSPAGSQKKKNHAVLPIYLGIG
jgi:hypothetical protein